MIRTLLVANRGEIARRVFRTARELGIRTVAVYSDPDAGSPHVREADRAVPLGGSTAAESYLDIAKILDAARVSGADAVHPGYGFLSENANFAYACLDAGLTFVGPSPDVIAAMGAKDRAKQIARSAGVPVLPDAGVGGDDPSGWHAAADTIGYPLIVKAVHGGGGKGMRLISRRDELTAAVEGARRAASSSFGDAAVFLERYLGAPRHIEVQVFGDTHGGAVHFGERECSVQRRHQKVLEETPSTAVTPGLRARMGRAAVALVQELAYVGAGTVEFLLDDAEQFWFLEMNTRLQVEHPVTEEVYGVDLVALQLRVAAGEPLGPVPEPSGHAIEVRLYAEDPAAGFRPAPGPLHAYSYPETGARIDDGVAAPGQVSPFYDPMLAKVIVAAPTRAEAAGRLARTLDGTVVHGVVTNRDLLAALLRDPDFLAGDTRTDFLDTHPWLCEPEPATPRLVHLAAAMAVTAARRRTADTVTGFAGPGFRSVAGGPPTSARWAPVAGEPVDVAYRLSAAAGAATLTLDVNAAVHEFGLRELGCDGVRVRHDGLEHGCAVSVHADGSVWVDDPLAHSGWRELPRLPEPEPSARAGGLVAEVPGTVVAVLVAPGDEVAAGQKLVVLEAMKMEHPTVAEAAGVVQAVHVEHGQYIAAHTVLVTLESIPE